MAKLFFAAALLCSLLCSYSNVLAKDIPDSWKDKIASYAELMNHTNKGISYKMKSVRLMKKKNGEIKEADTTYVMVKKELDGSAVFQQIDAQGMPIENKELDKHNEDQAEEEEGPGPLSIFGEKYRHLYSFNELKSDQPGVVAIEYEPLDPEALEFVGYEGKIEVDTTLWEPLSFNGSMNPLPKHVKEINLSITFEPAVDGVRFPVKMRTTRRAGFLFMKINFETRETFFDYKKIK